MEERDVTILNACTHIYEGEEGPNLYLPKSDLHNVKSQNRIYYYYFVWTSLFHYFIDLPDFNHLWIPKNTKNQCVLSLRFKNNIII